MKYKEIFIEYFQCHIIFLDTYNLFKISAVRSFDKSVEAKSLYSCMEKLMETMRESVMYVYYAILGLRKMKTKGK